MLATTKIWVVGTTNKAKVECVAIVARQCYPQFAHLIVPVAVQSAVSAQPMTALETQAGAEFRAKEANRLYAAACSKTDSTEGLDALLQKAIVVRKATLGDATGTQQQTQDFTPYDTTNKDHAAVLGTSEQRRQVAFGVGLEGGLEKIGERWFECGWMAVVEPPTGRIGIGSSARFEMSAKLMKYITDEKMELADVMDMLTGQTDVRSGDGAMGILTGGHLRRMPAYSHGLIFALAPFLSDPAKYW